MNNAVNSSNNAAPSAWLLDPISRCTLFVGDEHAICGVTKRGLISATSLSSLWEIAAERAALAKADLAPFKRLIAIAVRDEEFAKQEMKLGFPKLLSHSSVALWSAVETMVDDLLVAHLLHVAEASDLVGRSLPTARPLHLRKTDDASAREFIRRWSSQISIENVIDRYLAMLGVFHFKLDISSSNRRHLTELSEARNVILHKGGTIDARFLKKIPWAIWKEGQQYTINEALYVKFVDAIFDFTSKTLASALKSPWLAVLPAGEK